jgi:hypothetical protein
MTVYFFGFFVRQGRKHESSEANTQSSLHLYGVISRKGLMSQIAWERESGVAQLMSDLRSVTFQIRGVEVSSQSSHVVCAELESAELRVMLSCRVAVYKRIKGGLRRFYRLSWGLPNCHYLLR